MTRLKHPALLCLLTAACVACSTRQLPVAVDTEAQAREIAELEYQWSQMFGQRDIDGIGQLLANDSVLIMPGAEPIVGAADVRRVTEEMLASDDTVSWQSIRAHVAPSGDMAYDYGIATTRRADGSVVEGYYLVVWVREDGRWKVAADMFN